MDDALRVVLQHRRDAVVVACSTASRHWNVLTNNKNLDLPLTGAMSKGSSLALGIALGQPGRKVILLDGDGALVMNLGSLISVANKAPKNLVHCVVQNGMYATTGGQPVPGHDFASFAGMARECGYKAVYEFDNLEELATSAREVFSREGPVFVCLKVAPEAETRPIGQRTGQIRTPEAWPRVWKALRS